MWNDTRRGHNLIRKRYATRKFRLNVVNSVIIATCICVIIASIVCMVNANKNKQNVKAETIETNSKVNIYEEKEDTTAKTFTISILGEIMMGGNIGDNLSYNYMSAYKYISEYTKKADYTVASLATNVVDVSEIKDAKSKYIVTKKIDNAFGALGIDGINIATDHMLDFGKEVFTNTVNSLKNDYDIIGLNNKIMYAEHDGVKVAIIGVCNEVIGLEEDYTNAGIMMYNLNNIKSMIKEAKKNANTVIIMTHLGLENSHEVTSIMSWFYRKLIDYGADIVVGAHALGTYPIEIYEGKPIIYSTGYLMHDTNYLQGKKSAIYTLGLNEDGKIQNINIEPTYINAKLQTILYKDYNSKDNEEFLKYITSNISEETYKINNGEVNVTIK